MAEPSKRWFENHSEEASFPESDRWGNPSWRDYVLRDQGVILRMTAYPTDMMQLDFGPDLNFAHWTAEDLFKLSEDLRVAATLLQARAGVEEVQEP